MSNPVRVADLTGFDLMAPYFWKSEERLLLLRHVPGPSAEEAGHFEALIHDLTTQHSKPLEEFNAACAPLFRGGIMYVMSEGTPGHEITYTPPPCSISPDKRWLAAAVESPGWPPVWVAAPLELGADQAPQTFDAPSDLNPEVVSGIHPAWLPDSRRWVALIQVYDIDSQQYYFPRAVVHDTEDPRADRTITITDLPGLMVMGIIVGERPSRASGEAVLLYDLMLEGDAQENGVDSVELFALPLDADTTPVVPERWTVPLPGRRGLSWGALSPDGKRLAWLFSSFSATGISSEVWISGLNGEEMRHLCTIPGTIVSKPEAPSGQQFLFPMGMAWLPTGRAISYRYGDGLWVVPAD